MQQNDNRNCREFLGVFWDQQKISFILGIIWKLLKNNIKLACIMAYTVQSCTR